MKLEEKYRIEINRLRVRQEKRLTAAFWRVVDKISAIAENPLAKNQKSFKFNRVAPIKDEVFSVLANFRGEITEINNDAILKAWETSQLKQGETIAGYMAKLSFLRGSKTFFKDTNPDALKSYIDRTHKKLSNRIWNISEQFRDELELHLRMSVLNGDSAIKTARRVKQYLSEPILLFEKEKGLKKAVMSHMEGLGRGVYRSAMKNAYRLTRTEINTAYRENDFRRWNEFDFITGVKISVSAQHRIYDICDLLEGVYPKGFKFIGWHPQCLCHATPELMPVEDFIKEQNGEQVKKDLVKNVPENFEMWIKENKTRIQRMNNKPYFILDNFKDGDILKGIKNL